MSLNNVKTKIIWDDYLATAYAEGFCEGENATFEEQIEAWAYLIKTKLCYNLQGFFGRTAENFINKNFITKEGIINWDIIKEKL